MRKGDSENSDDFDWEPHHKWNDYVQSTYYQALDAQQQQNYEIHYSQPQDRVGGGSSQTTGESTTHGETIDVRNFQSAKRMQEWGTDHGWNHHVQQGESVEIPRAVAGHGKKFRRHRRGLKVSREELEEDLVR